MEKRKSSSWRLAISIGGGFLIPIKMDKTAKEDTVALHEYHVNCGGSGGRKKYCKTCSKELAPNDIIKGMEIVKGQVVTFSKEELESLPLSSVRTIDVAFTEAKEVDSCLFDTDYYLSPAEDMATKAFNLFAEGLRKLKKVAVGKVTIAHREHLCAIRPITGGLALTTLFWNDEIKPPPQVTKTKQTDTELDLISQLMGKFIKPFNHAEYSDNYNDALNKMAQDKLAGKPISAATDAPTVQPENLEDALRAHIAAVGKGKK